MRCGHHPGVRHAYIFPPVKGKAIPWHPAAKPWGALIMLAPSATGGPVGAGGGGGGAAAGAATGKYFVWRLPKAVSGVGDGPSGSAFCFRLGPSD